MLYKLESLRGVAACLVVLYHSPFNVGSAPLAFFANSYLFVDFFFVLSGFVMALAYGDRIHGDLRFGAYLMLRLGRIYPLHLFMLVLWLMYLMLRMFLYNAGLGGMHPLAGGNDSLYTFILNVFLLHSMGLHNDLSWNYPSWSISTEFFAYVAFFLLSLSLDRARRTFTPLLISLLAYSVLISLGRDSFDITYDFGFFRCLGAFYLGVFVFRSKSDGHFGPAAINVLEIAAIVFATTAVITAGIKPWFFFNAVAAFTFCIYVFSESSQGLVGRVLNHAALRAVGLWSYSIYMVHALVIAVLSYLAARLFPGNPYAALGGFALIANLLVLAVTIALSRVTYAHIERRFRNLVRQRVQSG